MTTKERCRILFASVGNVLEKIAAIFCIIAIGLMVIVVSCGVFFRYVISQPLGWTEEVSRYLMIWATCLAIGIAIYRKTHVGITYFLEKLSPGLKKWVMIFSDLLILGFLIIFTYMGYIMAVNGLQQVSPLLGFKMTVVQAAVPVGGLMCILLLVLRFLQDYLTQDSELS